MLLINKYKIVLEIVSVPQLIIIHLPFPLKGIIQIF